jgi:6-pyruvoyltetrahydropterin/6-carboxytetrahydropterin synthase
VEIVLSNADLDETGFVVDYGRLEPLQRLVAQQLDHRHLNDVMPAQPSAENIAKWIFDLCVENFDRPIAEMIVAIRVSETHKTYAEFRRH